MTGDRSSDKNKLEGALRLLKQAWDTNRAAHQALILAGQTEDSPELRKLVHNNEVYQRMTNKLQDLLDTVRNLNDQTFRRIPGSVEGVTIVLMSDE